MGKQIDVDKLIDAIKQQEDIAFKAKQNEIASERYWYNVGKNAVLQGLLEAIDHGFFDKKDE